MMKCHVVRDMSVQLDARHTSALCDVHNAGMHCEPSLPSVVHSSLLYYISLVPIYWYAQYIGTYARKVRAQRDTTKALTKTSSKLHTCDAQHVDGSYAALHRSAMRIQTTCTNSTPYYKIHWLHTW